MTIALIGLLGVAIGGVIGVISTILQQRYAESRWRKETKIKYLQDERIRLAEQYVKVGTAWGESAKIGEFSDEIVFLTLITLPSEVADAFFLAISELKNDLTKWAEISETFHKPMRKSLDVIDEEIKELLS